MISKKQRLDVLLVEKEHCDTREQARRMILAGEVKVEGHVSDKPGIKVEESVKLEVLNKPKYVGRGGLKLEGAIDRYEVDPTNLVCLDVGSSTGGFTDCLLQRGAKKVFAVDVGTNQLAWKIRSDSRVVVKEKFNARYLKREDLGEEIDLVVIDVSFISLSLILPAVFDVLKNGGDVIALLKPQFEVEKGEVGKGGIIRDDALREKTLNKIKIFVINELNQEWLDHMESPVAGMGGNREYLIWLKRR